MAATLVSTKLLGRTMRLLQLDGADGVTLTEDFHDDNIPRPYAILSHTWSEKEVTLQDLQEQGVGERSEYKKIRFCAQQARRDGIRYFWVDSCCIDKTNDAELSRAIKSMFRWYAQAEKCYVFLADVPRGDQNVDLDRDFDRSRWFTRGWTLQELLAPRTVEFFSNASEKLGDRVSLENQICEITGIPVRALRGSPVSTFTRAERFSWQQYRQTKVGEDMAYSMLGIFDVSMPVLYGEGSDQARKRLVKEIDINEKGTHYEKFSVPFTGLIATAYFVARESELEVMRKALSSDGSRRIVALHGLGGIGKTQLAVAYALRYQDSYSAIFWINIKDEVSAKQSFTKIAQQISRAYPSMADLSADDRDPDEVIEAVQSWLSLPHNTRWLMMFDNYDNPRTPSNQHPAAVDIRKYIPDVDQGFIIITTRSSEVEPEHSIHIKKLHETDHSLELLSRASGRSQLSEDVNAVKLAKQLDGLPLALATAGAYLRQSAVSIEIYLRFYDKSWAKLQKNSPNVTSYEDRTLYSTWQLSHDQIQQQSQVAANLLRLWAYFDNQDLWFELLNHVDDNDPAWFQELVKDGITFEAVVRTLCNHGIVEADSNINPAIESKGYSIHSCVHSWMKTVLNPNWDPDLARLAMICIARHTPPDTSRYQWQIGRRMVTHASHLCSTIEHRSDIGISVVWACHNIGSMLGKYETLKEAEIMLQIALKGGEAMQERETYRIAASRTRNALGNVFFDQGKRDQAKAMYMRALDGYEKVKEVDGVGVDLSDALNNLAVLYKDEGRLDEAEQVYLRVLARRESEFGKDHFETLRIVQNLGILYRKQHRLEAAENMYLRALHGRDNALGEDHIETLTTANNLGVVYQCQGRLEEAENMYLRVLRRREAVFGQDHFRTLDVCYNLGRIRRVQGRFDEAEGLLLRASSGYQAYHGENHKHTMDSVHELGLVLHDVGRFDEGVETLQRAVIGYQTLYRKNDETKCHVAYGLGCVLRKLKRPREAAEALAQALAGYREAHGEHHADTLHANAMLGLALFDQNRLMDAKMAYDRALPDYDKMYPSERHHVDELGQLLQGVGFQKHASTQSHDAEPQIENASPATSQIEQSRRPLKRKRNKDAGKESPKIARYDLRETMRRKGSRTRPS